jgi:uncharacterized membrane protein
MTATIETRRPERVVVAVLTALIVVYALYFTHRSVSQYHGYSDGTFDLGIYDQGIWLMSRFHAPFVTLIGRNLFGDHAQFSLLAVVPLYWIRPNATTLLGLQSLVLALGAVPVYLFARRRLRNPWFACVLAAAFLLHPVLGLTNLENYHPDSFVVPLLGFAIYAAAENKPRMFVVFSVLCLLCKEDVVLVLLPIAIWYAVRHNRRVGALVAGGSVLAALAAMNLVMRPLVGAATRNAYRIPFSSCGRACSVPHHLFDFTKTVFTNPPRVVRYLFSGGRPFYVWQVLLPTGFVFLLAPEIGATVVLALAANVFSTIAFQHNIAYHYSMQLLPALGMGTVYAVSRVRSEKRQAIAVVVVGVFALSSAYLWGAFPFSRHSSAGHPTIAATEVNNVIAQLPPNAVVSAYDLYAPHVDHRVHVYLWPTPFSASHWGLFKQEGQRLPEADTVEYVLVPAGTAGVPAGFTQIAGNEQAVLYKRVNS